MARLLVVSNRLPVTVRTEEGEVVTAPSLGGLATGLKGPHERSGGLWIGWPGDVADLDERRLADLDRQLAALRLVPVHLTAEEVASYYEGFSNGVLWPLFHYLLDRVPLHAADWEAYRRVNERFAEAVAARYEPGDLIWVQDYHLLLLPALLRQRLPDARIGVFLHIPFPSSEVFRILPWRGPILDGMLGADLVGFHTSSYVGNFASSVTRVLGHEVDGDEVRHRGRRVRLAAFPMGVDARQFASYAADPAADEEIAAIRGDGRERLLLGVDRLDYTKGIPRRMLAFERMLERDPSLRGRVRLVQIAVPSREHVGAYEEFRRQVNELVGRINGAWSTIESTPIHYLNRGFDQQQLAALYRAADVMLVTPLRDGMNLVAKEFVASRVDEDGVLVLSELAGAAAEMHEAVLVNPYDIDQVADAIRRALDMPANERRERMRTLRAGVFANDVQRWAESFVDALEEAGADRPALAMSPPEEVEAVLERIASAPRLTLLLDYDGTLVPFAPRPEQAAPDPELIGLLGRLARRPGTEVHVVSGRRRDSLERWLGDLPIGLHAEHGFWTREGRGEEWEAQSDPAQDALGRIRPVLDGFSRRTPGSFVEEKSAALAWHYRRADPETGALAAKELRLLLMEALTGTPLEVIPGSKVVEVRARGVNKGLVAIGAADPDALVVAIGDDRTDEDLFAALPERGIAIHVGPAASIAPVRLADIAAARRLLEAIAATSPRPPVRPPQWDRRAPE